MEWVELTGMGEWVELTGIGEWLELDGMAGWVGDDVEWWLSMDDSFDMLFWRIRVLLQPWSPIGSSSSRLSFGSSLRAAGCMSL